MPRDRSVAVEGTVYFLKGRGWHVAFYDADGRRKYRKSPVQSEKAAHAFLRDQLNKRDRGELTTKTLTVGAWFEQWLDIKKTQDVRPRTLEAYRDKLAKHVIPEIGGLRLDRLTAGHLDRLYAKLLTQPSGRKTGTGGGRGKSALLSPSTVAGIHTILGTMLIAAHKRRLVGVVATELVDPPKVRKYEARILSVEEARTLMKAVRGHRYGPLWTFMFGTGCRFGEAAGLTWEAVDLEDQTARIFQQVTRERVNGHIVHHLAPVKTDAGRRTLALPDFVIDALHAQHRLTHELREIAGRDWKASDLVFPTHTGDLLRENVMLVTWHRLLRSIGLEGPGQGPLRPHDLRHAKGTLMADAGEDLVVIQKTLGHARSSITADLYIGNTPTALRGAADRFGRMLGE